MSVSFSLLLLVPATGFFQGMPKLAQYVTLDSNAQWYHGPDYPKYFLPVEEILQVRLPKYLETLKNTVANKFSYSEEELDDYTCCMLADGEQWVRLTLCPTFQRAYEVTARGEYLLVNLDYEEINEYDRIPVDHPSLGLIQRVCLTMGGIYAWDVADWESDPRFFLKMNFFGDEPIPTLPLRDAPWCTYKTTKDGDLFVYPQADQTVFIGERLFKAFASKFDLRDSRRNFYYCVEIAPDNFWITGPGSMAEMNGASKRIFRSRAHARHRREAKKLQVALCGVPTDVLADPSRLE